MGNEDKVARVYCYQHEVAPSKISELPISTRRVQRCRPTAYRSVDSAFRRIAIAFFFTIFLSSIMMAVSRSEQEMILMGRITDALTGHPFIGATVHIWGLVQTDGGGTSPYNLFATSDEYGYFLANLPRGNYRITVVVDYPETPGLDYVPGFLQLDTTSAGGNSVTINFHLIRGVPIRITGSADFVESGRAPGWLYFGFDGAYYITPSLNGSLTYYDPEITAALGLESNVIIAPVNVPTLLYGVSPQGRFVIDDNGGFFLFSEPAVIDISEAVSNRNVRFMSDALASMWLRVKELGLNGIDVRSELEDLDTAFGYVDLARLSLQERSYSQCFMNLRAAYTMDQDLRARLDSILVDIAFTPIPLSFMLVLAGFGLAAVFVEKGHTRVGAGMSISALLLGYYFYISPGWRLTDPLMLFASSAVAAILATGLVTIVPTMKRDVITPSGIPLASSLTSTFALAARNLKRRRLRASLILTSILTLVFGFTVFTSFEVHSTVAYGRTTSPYPNASPPTGLMIVPPPGPSSILPTSIIGALESNPAVASVAPKTETSPGLLDAALFSERGSSMRVRGAIGISDAEVGMTQLDAAVIEGHYMAEEEHAIMISKRAADLLGVVPGSKVRFSWGAVETDFMVAGVLDDQIFEGIYDLDGQPIRPYFFIDHSRAYIGPESVVVFNWRELLELGLGRLTRVNVQARVPGDIIPLATDLTRKLRYFIYASQDGEVRLLHYAREPSLMGGSVVPMLMALVGLNVLACTLNAAYERRKEIMTLSLVGLNPSQICYIFLAEAGLVAFLGGMMGYLMGIGIPRMLFSFGELNFLAEKISWAWSVAVILMSALVAISASVYPALKASTIATPSLPLRWKLDYVMTDRDTWMLHIPQIVSQLELRRFFRFMEAKFEETQQLRYGQEKMQMMGITDESDREREVRRLRFTYGFVIEGSRALRTMNELVLSRTSGSTFSVDLNIKIDILHEFSARDAAMRTAKAVRRLMLQWTATPPSTRWGEVTELVRVEGLSVLMKGEVGLKDIDLTVTRGEIVGLSGEGRRTLILAIAGLCKATGGSVLVGGVEPHGGRNWIEGSLGVIMRDAEIGEELSPRQKLAFLAEMEGVADVNATVNVVLKMCGLSQYADEKIAALNPDAMKRVMMAQAFIRDVSVLLIEDPFADFGKDEAKDFESLLIYMSHSMGTAIICTGRNVEELAFCSRILVLKDGSMGKVIDRRGEG